MSNIHKLLIIVGIVIIVGIGEVTLATSNINTTPINKNNSNIAAVSKELNTLINYNGNLAVNEALQVSDETDKSISYVEYKLEGYTDKNGYYLSGTQGDLVKLDSMQISPYKGILLNNKSYYYDCPKSTWIEEYEYNYVPHIKDIYKVLLDNLGKAKIKSYQVNGNTKYEVSMDYLQANKLISLVKLRGIDLSTYKDKLVYGTVKLALTTLPKNKNKNDDQKVKFQELNISFKTKNGSWVKYNQTVVFLLEGSNAVIAPSLEEIINTVN